MDARERYVNDVHFRALVDTLASYVLRHEFTPSEVRLASIMASIKAEQFTLRPGFVLRELKDAVRQLEDG